MIHPNEQIKMMPLITWAGMTCFSHCSLVTLEWGHNTWHDVHCRDCLVYATFSVADPKMDPVLVFLFTSHAKHISFFLYNVNVNTFLCISCKTLFFFHIHIVKQLLCKAFKFLFFIVMPWCYFSHLLPLPATSHPKTAGGVKHSPTWLLSHAKHSPMINQ